MIDAGAWLAAALVWPLAMLAGCLWRPFRVRAPVLLALASAPALGAALFAWGGDIVLPRAMLGLSLSLDGPGAILLGAAAMLWVAAGLYASSFLRTQTRRDRFVMWWLATVTGSLGVFMAADLVSFYVLFSVVSLAAFGLVIHEGTPDARHAGGVYLILALLGECLLLLAFVLLAAATPEHSLLIRDVVAALPGSPRHDLIMTLLLVGFGLKVGLVPLHVWMPIAHPAAPIPASAVLSGIVVKAGVIGLIRFLPFQGADATWGGALAAAGLLTAYYAVLIGVTQTNPKTILAYSSISQMGLIATVLGTALAVGNGAAAVPAAIYAANHVLVKGALFMGVGVVQATGKRHVRGVMTAMILLALSLGGLPLTGGALSKLVVKPLLGSGVEGSLAAASAVGSVLLMSHFLVRLALQAVPDGPPAARPLLLPFVAGALACAIVPWMLYLGPGGGTLATVVSPPALWSASWPVLLGIAMWRLLRSCERHLPRIPAGDIEVPAEEAVRTVASILSDVVARLDAPLLQWPTASVLLVGMVLVLSVAMLVGP